MSHIDITPRIEIELAGETVALLGGRALFRPKTNQLLIADFHLGKGDILRRAGISLPSGGTQDDLVRLSYLVEREQPTSLVILGDFLHGPVRRSKWLSLWTEWRTTHASLHISVVAGNHDRALVPERMEVQLLPEGSSDSPFVFCHRPALYPGKHVICGHIHPVAILPGMRGRWPAFYLTEHQIVLPAFSQFTGGHVIRGDRENSVFVCVNGMIVEVPSVPPGSTQSKA